LQFPAVTLLMPPAFASCLLISLSIVSRRLYRLTCFLGSNTVRYVIRPVVGRLLPARVRAVGSENKFTHMSEDQNT